MNLNTSKNRILFVDSLRGFALLGMVLTHIRAWFVLSIIPSIINIKYQNDLASVVVNQFNNFFIVGKFYTIFSLLFGISFGIQLAQRKTSDKKFIPRFIWRLLVLFIIGFIHHVLWNGDVLGVYAFLGIFLILLRNIGSKTLLSFALFFILILPSFLRNQIQFYGSIPKAQTRKGVEMGNVHQEKSYIQSFYTLKEGNYQEIISQNLKGLKTKVDYQFNTSRIFVTFGFMLFGLFIGRGKVLENLELTRPYLSKILLLLIIVTSSCVILLKKVDFGLNSHEGNSPIIIFHNFLILLKSLFITLTYITGLFYLSNLKQMVFVNKTFATIGKMAMTNYLMQSAFGVLLFYGIGLGFAGDISPAWCYVIGIGIFIFQVIFSKWWLSKFYYGPIEWLWRSATYLKWQTITR
ncbi:DUF418 domain-containing protein [Arcicella rosea]|uniref:DUF418 domain-containing protein n=1 Tax=Arcicella rosea TaxID=502909 RepID=A0A841ERR2_9BACT|nr:DUF418 domain-containing protein [Arcicella rosea]MBB6004974.1 uncharacterized protein [Arcicella rosea]